MTVPVLLAVLAVGFVTIGVSLIVGLDGALAPGGRFAPSAVSGSILPGPRVRRRDARKANPVLYLLSSVLALLVIATLV